MTPNSIITLDNLANKTKAGKTLMHEFRNTYMYMI